MQDPRVRFCDGGVCHTHYEGEEYYDNSENHGGGNYPQSCPGAHGFNEECLASRDLFDLGDALDGLIQGGEFERAEQVVMSAEGVKAERLQAWPAIRISKTCEATGALISVLVPLTSQGWESLAEAVELEQQQ